MTEYLPYVAIVFTAVAALWGWFGVISKMQSDIRSLKEQCECIPEMRREVTTMMADTKTFWKVIEPHLGTIIHSPVHKDRDSLVDDFIAGRLTLVQLRELDGHLDLLLDEEPIDDVKYLAGALLQSRVKAQLAILAAQHELEKERDE